MFALHYKKPNYLVNDQYILVAKAHRVLLRLKIFFFYFAINWFPPDLIYELFFKSPVTFRLIQKR